MEDTCIEILLSLEAAKQTKEPAVGGLKVGSRFPIVEMIPSECLIAKKPMERTESKQK